MLHTVFVIIFVQYKLYQDQKTIKPNPNHLTVSLDQGTKEAGTTYCTDYLTRRC